LDIFFKSRLFDNFNSKVNVNSKEKIKICAIFQGDVGFAAGFSGENV